MLLHGAAKCVQCTHMARKELKPFLFYTDVLSCRVQAKLCVRLRFRKLHQRLEKDAPKDRKWGFESLYI